MWRKLTFVSWPRCGEGEAPDHAGNMFERRRIKCCIVLAFSVFAFGIIYLGYFCPDKYCALTSGTSISSLHKPQYEPYVKGRTIQQGFESEDLVRDYEFDIDGDEDVLVFIHIQKTGGTTFGKHLVKNIDVKTPCICYSRKKRCDCENKKRHIWLFSRYSTGWSCGLHADWTELHACVNSMLDRKEGTRRPRRYRYLYISILRSPYNRYLSEFKHVQRGATWLAARLSCNGRQASLEEVPFCFQGEDWEGVTLEEFMTCPDNLANNRQTRMLADLSLVGCYNRSAMSEAERSRLMLQSAKDNLRDMAFFGLTEYQRETQYLFERTFHLKFKDDFVQYNQTHASAVPISEDHVRRINQINDLDAELYRYAKDLFFQRLARMRKEDTNLRTNGGGEGDAVLDLQRGGGSPGFGAPAPRGDNRAIGSDSARGAGHVAAVDYEEGDENYEDDYDDLASERAIHMRQARDAASQHRKRRQRH